MRHTGMELLETIAVATDAPTMQQCIENIRLLKGVTYRQIPQSEAIEI